MTTEERFKKLLYIATANGFTDIFGYNINNTQIFVLTIYTNNTIDLSVYNDNEEWTVFSITFSINDLILNTNFFECLFKPSEDFCLFRGNLDVYIRKWVSTEENTKPSWQDVDIFNPDIVNRKRDKYGSSGGCGNGDIPLIKKFQWVLEVEKGTALEWLFKQFGI